MALRSFPNGALCFCSSVAPRLGPMAQREDTTDGVKFLSEVFYDNEGNQVDDPKDSAIGYVTMQFPDGTIEHSTVVNTKNYTGTPPGPPPTVTLNETPPAPQQRAGRRAIRRKR